MKPPFAQPTRIVSAAPAGFSLIELLVSMVIGLVVTLAITSVLIRTEGSKRSTTSVNDLNQTGAFTTFLMDRAIRSAGSGFAQSWSTAFGCLLDVRQGATQVLPVPSAFPASSAFASVTATSLPKRLAPVIIGKGLADSGVQVRGDVLMVMGGTGGGAETGAPVAPSTATSPPSIAMSNTLGYRASGGDLVLLADPGVAAGCMVQQVASATATTLSLGGTYYASTGTNVNLANFTASTLAMQLGKDTDNPPQFQLYGVGANNTLMTMDLLKPFAASTAPDIAVADGVVEMRAVYGISSAPPYASLDTWVDPSGTTWGAAALTDGTAAAKLNLRKIVAIRLGMILRTSLQEAAPVTGPADPTTHLGTLAKTITLFSDLPPAVQQTRTYAAGTVDLNYRYRAIEITIPLRNVLAAPQS